jgi:hypothetical protein
MSNGILAYQPGGAGVVAIGNQVNGTGTSLLAAGVQLTFTGSTTSWAWSITSVPAQSTRASLSYAAPNSPSQPEFIADVVGSYILRFVDSGGNVYTLIISVTNSASVATTAFGFVDPATYGAVGDGVADDTQAIQAALNAVQNNGGLALRSGAIYRITAQLLWAGASLGSPKTNMRIVGNGATFQMTRNIKFMALYNIAGCEMTGFSVLGTLQTDGGDPLGSPANTNQGVLEIGGAAGTSTRDVDVHNCTWQDIGGYAIWPGGNTRDVRIHHDSFIRTQAGVQTSSGTQYNRDLSICDNYFLGNVWAAASANKTLGSDDQIGIFSGAGRVIVRGNMIDKQGLRQVDGTTNDASTNQARAIDVVCSVGADITELIIDDNTVVNCISTNTTYARPAIEIFGDDTLASKLETLSISGNTIRYSNQAIAMYGPAKNGVCANNMISDVTSLGGHSESATEGDGILIQGPVNSSAGWTIIGNAVTRADAASIKIANLSKSSVVGNVLTAIVNRGIVATTVTDVTFGQNVCDGGSDYGMVLSGYVRCLVAGNTIRGAASYALSLQGSSNSALFFGNQFQGTSGKISDGTSGSTNRFVANDDYLVGSASWDPVNVAAGSSTTTTVTVTDAALGDGAEASFSLDLAGLTLSAYVNVANTVTCVLSNNTAGPINLGNGTVKAWVTKR